MPHHFRAYCRSMKHPTLQKVSLIAIALVACFAVGANARTRANVTTAAQNKKATHKPAMNARGAGHGSQSITSTYMIDDGTMENGVGFGNGLQNFESIWLNQFDVIPGETTISASPSAPMCDQTRLAMASGYGRPVIFSTSQPSMKVFTDM